MNSIAYVFSWLAISEIGTELAPLGKDLSLIRPTERRFHDEGCLIVRLKQMAVGDEGNSCGRMAQAPANCEHVHTRGNQGAGVGVSEGVKGGGYANTFHGSPPLIRQRVRRSRRAVPLGEHQSVVRCLTLAQSQPVLLLGSPVRPQHGDGGGGEGDGARPVARLGGFNTSPCAAVSSRERLTLIIAPSRLISFHLRASSSARLMPVPSATVAMV